MLDASGRRPVIGKAALPIALVAAALLLSFGAYFATVQSVWIDESTQLLGSGLPLGRMLHWLAGGFEPLGVPGDRMPPGSYLLDWACGRTACSAPFDFRLLHLAIASVGVALTTWLAARRYGTIAGIVTGLLLVLLPQMTAVAVEIRAYPIFFTLTAVQLTLLLRLFDRHELELTGVLAFAAVGLLSTYTHFFGLIASSAMFTGLAAAQVRSRRCIVLVFGSWAAQLLLSVGLLPFIGGARAISSAPAVEVGLGNVAGYLARILGGAPMLLQPGFSAIFFAGLALLLAAFVLQCGRMVMRWPPRAPFDAPAAVAIALLAGIAVTILGGLVVHGFDPMKPSYSIWVLPLLALLIGYVAATHRLLAAIAAAMLLALLPIQILFLRHAELFIHGPELAIEAALGVDAAGTALVYAGEGWAFPYFPLIYRYGPLLDHYRRDPAGMLHRIGPGGDGDTPAVPPAALDRYDHVVLIDVATETGRDMRHFLQGNLSPALLEPDTIAAAPLDPLRWREAGAFVRPGLYWLKLTKFEKK